MKLIVGLGNPGKEYEKTKHNMGFMAIDEYAKSKNVNIDKTKFNGLFTIIKEDEEQIILLKPQEYINLSGDVIKRFVDFYKINIDDILIICDDLDTPLGKLKLKLKGSSGGHNGLKNIEANLKTKEYKRIKIGISNDKTRDTKDYVLSKLSKEENDIINQIIGLFPNIINDYLTMSFDNLMNKYNKWYWVSFLVLEVRIWTF